MWTVSSCAYDVSCIISDYKYIYIYYSTYISNRFFSLVYVSYNKISYYMKETYFLTHRNTLNISSF